MTTLMLTGCWRNAKNAEEEEVLNIARGMKEGANGFGIFKAGIVGNEGNVANEAAYFSHDGGGRWRLANHSVGNTSKLLDERRDAHAGVHQTLVVVVLGYVFFSAPGVILHILCIVGAASGNPFKPDPNAPTPETHVMCPDCRELVLKDARVCKHCGCKLVPQWYCSIDAYRHGVTLI